MGTKHLIGKRLEVESRVQAVIDRAELTQREVARRTGLGPQVISALCTGAVTNPAHDSVLRLCYVLGCKGEDLFQVKAVTE